MSLNRNGQLSFHPESSIVVLYRKPAQTAWRERMLPTVPESLEFAAA